LRTVLYRKGNDCQQIPNRFTLELKQSQYCGSCQQEQPLGSKTVATAVLAVVKSSQGSILMVGSPSRMYLLTRQRNYHHVNVLYNGNNLEVSSISILNKKSVIFQKGGKHGLLS